MLNSLIWALLLLHLVGVVWQPADTKSVPTATKVEDNASKLIYVQLLYRHGDRAPDKSYKKSPFANSWPQGHGQLTTFGIQQHYTLGQFLRKRYKDFLGLETDGVYYPDVYIRSTDVERAVSSALTNTAAFFRPPPNKFAAAARARSWQANDSDFNQLWQPVPIHTVPAKHDWVMHQGDCELLDVRKKEFEEGPKIQAIEQKPATQECKVQRRAVSTRHIRVSRIKQALLRSLSHVTGEPFDAWTLTKTFKDVADALYCENRHGMSLRTVPAQFYDEVEALRERIWPMPYNEPNQVQLRGGCILDTIAQNMRNKLDKKVGKKSEVLHTRKLVVYSGHDTTILGLVSAAGLLDKVAAKPQYATAIFFELYSDGMVEILWKGNTTSLEAIRTTQPVLLLRAPLLELENRWKDSRIDEKKLKLLCEVPTAEKLVVGDASITTAIPPNEESEEEDIPVNEEMSTEKITF